MSVDKIEKHILLKAPRSRVWQAVTRSAEFGSWFGMKLEGEFRVGRFIHGQISPTTVDAEVAQLQKPHEGKKVEFWVESIEPETRFCLKWHPYAVDPKTDYSQEPMTLITFTFEHKDGGTLLTITEEGFEGIPLARRADDAAR
jgi:uncharacterized protein YndB with AHSA1/START domain